MWVASLGSAAAAVRRDELPFVASFLSPMQDEVERGQAWAAATNGSTNSSVSVMLNNATQISGSNGGASSDMRPNATGEDPKKVVTDDAKALADAAQKARSKATAAAEAAHDAERANAASQAAAEEAESKAERAASKAGLQMHRRGSVLNYLREVYPTAKLDEKAATKLFAKLDYVYPRQDIASLITNYAAASSAPTSCRTGGYTAAAKGHIGPGGYVKYSSFVPCHMNETGTGCVDDCTTCVQRRHDYKLPGVHPRYLEVRHAAMADKFFTDGSALCPATSTWRAGNCTFSPKKVPGLLGLSSSTHNVAFVDPGPGGMWYYHHRGSGIFYDAGRTLAVPTKNDAMAQLLSELHVRPEARKVVCKLFSTSRSAVTDGVCDISDEELHDLSARISRTADGSQTCKEAKVIGCYGFYPGLEDPDDGYDLNDDWDVPILWIARILRYETILTYASFHIRRPVRES
jgi:hypothetical protein